MMKVLLTQTEFIKLIRLHINPTDLKLTSGPINDRSNINLHLQNTWNTLCSYQASNYTFRHHQPSDIIYKCVRTYWSSVVTVYWPLEPQSLLGPEILARPTYQLLACSSTGSSNSSGYFSLERERVQIIISIIWQGP